MKKLSIVAGLVGMSIFSIPMMAQAEPLSPTSLPEMKSETVALSPTSLPEMKSETVTFPTTPIEMTVTPKVEIAQSNIDPGRLTRHNYSYLAVGVNIGMSNETTPLSDDAFAINSKIALGTNVSLRPAIVFGNDTGFLVPITYDFTIKGEDPFEEQKIVPFVGGGAIFANQNNNNAGFLLTAGLDYKMSKNFVANVAVNTGFMQDSTDVGLMLSLGYIIQKGH